MVFEEKKNELLHTYKNLCIFATPKLWITADNQYKKKDMNKKLSLLTLGLTWALSLQASDWAEDLVSLNPGVIDSVVYLPSTAYGPKTLRSYMIYYHQPLLHDQPELGELPLRALLTLRYREDVTQKVTHVNIGGYSLDENVVTYPNYYANYYFTNSGGELAGRYRGNLLQPEHRYFGQSCPAAPWETLGYCEAKEAAADFHALIEAMKKVFHGKWAISGVSKGGTTTTIQQAFYPEDADCFVPYSGPFLDIDGDTRMQEHWMLNAWTPEMRESMLHIQKEMLNRAAIYPYYCQYYGWDPEEVYWGDFQRTFFLMSAGMIDFDLHAYSSREEVADLIASNQEYLAQHELDDYTDEMLLYMLVENTLVLDDKYDVWYDNTFEPEETTGYHGAPRRMKSKGHELVQRIPLPVFGIKESDWNPGITGYYYQAMHELGYFDLKWDYFYDTQAEADSVNTMWSGQTDNVLAFANYTFSEVVFNPSLMEEVRRNTGTSQSKILFIYGSDDTWTGACMDDEYINDENVRLYILPAQNHGVSINAVEDWDLKDELWEFTDAIFDPEPEAIVSTQADDDNATPTIYYDLFGRRLETGALRNKLVIKK